MRNMKKNEQEIDGTDVFTPKQHHINSGGENGTEISESG